VKEMGSAYDFDIKKVDKIFDFSLEKKQLKLSLNHVIPSAELKGKRYYKFHNATTHSTNECRVFRQHVQKAIKQGKMKFESTKKPTMGIDGHPFRRVNMVEFQLIK
jgi:tRNA splicing ligase